MLRTRIVTQRIFVGSLAIAAVAAATGAGAQIAVRSAPPVAPHAIIVRLIDQPGSKPFAFEPATFTAQRGDTLRFVQASNAMHDVRFSSQPKGARLGGAGTSPYLTTIGDSYTMVVDGRFTDGSYEIVCDPHGALGMHGFLTVAGSHLTGGKP